MTFLMRLTQARPSLIEEDVVHSDEVDSDRFSGSNSSFLANEKLVSVDSMNSDVTGILFLLFRVFLHAPRIVGHYKLFSR